MRIYPWFALQVRTGGESLVETSLRSKEYQPFLPTYLESRRYSDRMKKVRTALFPGYLFCRFDPERRLPILTTTGVHRILTINDQPAPVPDNEIEAIQRLVSTNADVQPWPFLKAGAPSLDIIQLNSYPYWHTPEDTLDKISARSLQAIGDVLLASLPRIEKRLKDEGKTGIGRQGDGETGRCGE